MIPFENKPSRGKIHESSEHLDVHRTKETIFCYFPCIRNSKINIFVLFWQIIQLISASLLSPWNPNKINEV
jgi:hypothetical protein